MARKGKGSVSSEKAAARAPANAANDHDLRVAGMSLALTKHVSLVEDHGKLDTCQFKAGDDNAAATGLAVKREASIEKLESERNAKEMECDAQDAMEADPGGTHEVATPHSAVLVPATDEVAAQEPEEREDLLGDREAGRGAEESAVQAEVGAGGEAAEHEAAQCASLAEAAAAVKQRVHAFMQYRRVLQLRMGKASGAGELALMTKLLGRPRATPAATPWFYDKDLRAALYFTPTVLELKAQSSFWATFEMKDRSLALAQQALGPQYIAEHEVVSSDALVTDRFVACTRILQRHGAFALKPVIGECGGGVLIVRAWDSHGNRPLATTSALSCDAPLAQFHMYSPITALADELRYTDKEGAEPLHEKLRSWVQEASQGFTRYCFETETADEGERWLVEQLTPTLEGFGPFELRIFVLGGVATCVIFDELDEADERFEFATWRDFQRGGKWSATLWVSAPTEHEQRRRFVDRLLREFVQDLARDAEALAKAAGACLIFRADFFLFPTDLDGGSSWELDEFAKMDQGTDLRSIFSYRLNEMQYWLGSLITRLEKHHITFVLEALKALLTEFEESRVSA